MSERTLIDCPDCGQGIPAGTIHGCPRPVSSEAAPPPVTMWVAECPFRKNGSPVLGTMGSRIDTVIVFTSAEWKRLCAEVPQLATTPFRVGTYD